MSDIVERLRKWNPAMQPVPPEVLLRSAADEIERLENGVLYLEAVIGNQDAIMTERMQPVIDAARNYLSDHSNESEQELFDALTNYDRDGKS